MVASCPKSSKTATNEYRISIEGNPYPHTLALINPAGDNLNIKKHGFTGPLGQLLSLKYTVYDDANENSSLSSTVVLATCPGLRSSSNTRKLRCSIMA